MYETESHFLVSPEPIFLRRFCQAELRLHKLAFFKKKHSSPQYNGLKSLMK